MSEPEKNNQLCPGCGYPAYTGHSSQCSLVNQIKENPLTDLVLDNIQDYEELNADSLKDSKQNFTAALIKALKTKEVEATHLGIGSQSLVQRLSEAKGLVVKRLMLGKKLNGQGDMTPDQYFNHKRNEYDLVKKYFGSDFTPDTEFVEVDTNFNNPHLNTIPGHEYIMVQEELTGEDVTFQAGAEHDFDVNKISPKLKERLESFVKRYTEMQTGSRTVIEDQVRVDFDKGKVYIQDTDFLVAYDKFTKDNPFLEYVGQGDADVSDVGTIINLLAENFISLEVFNKIGNEKLNEKIPLSETTEVEEAQSALMKKLNKEGKSLEEKKEIIFGFARLITAIDYFPPTGDNIFLKRFKKAFHLDETIGTNLDSTGLD